MRFMKLLIADAYKPPSFLLFKNSDVSQTIDQFRKCKDKINIEGTRYKKTMITIYHKAGVRNSHFSALFRYQNKWIFYNGASVKEKMLKFPVPNDWIGNNIVLNDMLYFDFIL